ncbi:MAG TPA: TlpA disulfide reductase family protein [Chitinophagaceae bacterium]|nr:MAG: alkyl hydroperoxide reductase/ Thiol specific antioxidant/ Mal allergen [Bacteroidetes bacterium OLB11]HMN32562.1 TlpA disulfide reductase family protein [Chitinophagaceae bacterium]
MNKLFLIAILTVVCFFNTSGQPKSNFKMKLTVEDENEGIVYFRNLTLPSIDTLKYSNKTCQFSGYVKEPTPFIISNENNKYQLFFIGPNDNINITLHKKEMKVVFMEGSPSHEIFRELIIAQEPIQQEGASIQQAFQNPQANTDSLNKALAIVNNKLHDNFFHFLHKNSNSEVTAFVIYSAISNDRNIKVRSADSMFQLLEGKAKTCFYGNEVNKMLSKLKAVEVGYVAPNFKLADSTGKKEYSLSDFKGKYVLIDFWASWCGPCKNEIPYLKKAYEMYHQKGFEIVSVSLDDKKEKWTAALRQYQMPWIHISDVKGFNSAVNELYHVPAIPTTLLLDKTGTIIATNLRGNALENKLAELLKP